MNNTLYCFVSHEQKITEDSISIESMMKKINCHDYVIVYGGNNKSINHPKVIHIDCDDSWCGLPEKINKMFKCVTDRYDYDFYVKLDRTVIVHKLLNDHHKINYGGFIHNFDPINGKWKIYHFGRCDSSSRWYEKPFYGTALKFCSGVAYILSKENAKIVAQDDSIYLDHIYEDYYVGTLVKMNNIEAQYLPIKEYYFDPEHRWMFK